MSALLEGFRTGYDRMNQFNQQEENKRRYEQGMQRQQGLDQMNQESHNAQMQNSALNRQVLQNNVDRMPVDNQYTDQVRDLEMEGAQQRNKNYKLENEASALKIDNNRNDAKQLRALQKFQSYATSGQWADMVQDKDFEGTDVELVFNGTGRKAALGLSDSISNQDWAGATQNFNKLYKPKLNRMVGSKGRNGSKILDVEATGFEPQEDGTMKIPVYVTTEKGGGYTSYVSQLRSSDENDPHKQFQVDELIGKAAGLGNLAAIMESSGVNQQMGERAQKYQRANTGDQKMPAQAQNAKYMAQAMGIPEGQAWEIMMSAKSNPNAMKEARAKFVQNYVMNNEEVKSGFATPEQQQQLMQQGSRMFDQLMADPQEQDQRSAPGGNSQIVTLLEQAKTAIANGKDKAAVTQRLIEMGVPQDQIQL